MSHFVYGHMPAIGLGYRHPTRPFVTGGLGRAVIYVFPPSSLRMRAVTVDNVDVAVSTVEGERK